jgi:micrococcal nuclease
MRKHFRSVFLACIAQLFCSVAAFADEPARFEARAYGVNDGDTCRIETPSGHHYRVRLFGIDAPESDQPHGTAARDALRELISGRDVMVQFTGAQTYGRRVARIYIDDVYVNHDMVADGWAWHYDRYTEDEEREEFVAAEESAQEERVGLWVDDNPIKPECWRRGDRDGDCEPDFGPEAFADRARTPPRAAVGREPSVMIPDAVRPRVPAPAARSRTLSPVERFENFMGESDARTRFDALTDHRERRESAHVLFGNPKEDSSRFRFTPDGEENEVRGITELRRAAFTVGHHDRYRQPAWVAMRWSKEDWERGQGVSMRRPRARVDTDLPEYARGGTSFEFDRTGLEKGHMAPDDLMESWGVGAVEEAVRMSNMVPQLRGRNHAVWGVLEKEIREIVADDEDDVEIDQVWTIAGPVFGERSRDRRVGTPGTRVPDATYKIVVPVDRVEELTGLDFFSEMDDAPENRLEAAQADSLWE